MYSLQLTGLMQWSIRAFIDTENGMTSVERLLEFSAIPAEAPYSLPSDAALGTAATGVCKLAGSGPSEVTGTGPSYISVSTSTEVAGGCPGRSNPWPQRGEIVIKNLRLKYRPELECILKGVSLTIPARAKVGICGRTGSGKSSLMLALFRLVEYEQESGIHIDGADIREVGLFTLRSQLTIIPQDPVMFCGTLRYNLDPFSQYSDADIWDVLGRVQLKTVIQEKFPLQLSAGISERGENISVGQRQLLCIARALLRKSRIIILDEVRVWEECTRMCAYVYVYICV